MGLLRAAVHEPLMVAPAAGQQLAEIYTLMCRAAMNKEYYGTLLARSQTFSSWMDILIAIGTTGSGLSGLAIWNNFAAAKTAWAALTLISAALAVTKPVMQISKRIERLSKLFAGHAEIYASMMILASRIKRQGGVSDEILTAFAAAEERFQELSKDDDPSPDQKLLRRCQDAVRRRHPPDQAWYPEAVATSPT